KVSLYKNGVKIAETTTDVNGEYYFTNKNQSGTITWLGTGRDTAVLPMNQYDIVFGEGQYANGKLSVNGDNYLITEANDPASELTDSDVTENAIAGGTYPSILGITAPNSGNDYSFDAGFYPVGSIGDYVWTDNNGDGVQDAGDTPIKDVVVNLLDGNGVLITTTMTDADGKYLFPNLNDGSYIIEFEAPSGKTFVSPTLGGNTTLDSDAGVAGKSAVITINTSLAAGNVGRDNLTIDAGICVNPNAGTDATSCVGLTADLTDATANQTWSAKAGNPSAATIDATTGITSALTTAGDYYFVLTNTAGCSDEVLVTVNPPVNAGSATNPAAICAAATGLATLTLSDLLTGEDAGGTWTSTGDNAGANFTAAAGTLNQNALAAGTYKFLYTVTGASPCPNDTEEVTIVINNCAPVCPPKVCAPVKVVKL
ncbi:MAG: SdrD B-like domain-containing protein, partial [Wohlfahrtiimonas sp.]